MTVAPITMVLAPTGVPQGIGLRHTRSRPGSASRMRSRAAPRRSRSLSERVDGRQNFLLGFVAVPEGLLTAERVLAALDGHARELSIPPSGRGLCGVPVATAQK